MSTPLFVQYLRSPLGQAVEKASNALAPLGPLTGAVHVAAPETQLRLLAEAQTALLHAAAELGEARLVVERELEETGVAPEPGGRP